MASTYRIHCYAKALQEGGVEVICIQVKKKLPGTNWYNAGTYDGVPFVAILIREQFKNRWLNYLWADLNSYFLLWNSILTSSKYEVLWLYGIGTIPRVLLIPILHLLGKKIVLELNEYPYSTEGNKYTRIPIIRKML